MKAMRALLVVVCALLLSPSFALAQTPREGSGPSKAGGPGPGGGMRMGMGMGPGCGMGAGFGLRAIRELNLTSNQQDQIAALENRFDSQVVPLREQIMADHNDLRNLWNAATPDREAILDKQADIARIHENMGAMATDFRLGVLRILTPEQRARLVNMPAAQGGSGPAAGGCPMCGGD